jgi:hypothetical protein
MNKYPIIGECSIVGGSLLVDGVGLWDERVGL